jgi:hypothetical protein
MLVPPPDVSLALSSACEAAKGDKVVLQVLLIDAGLGWSRYTADGTLFPLSSSR